MLTMYLALSIYTFLPQIHKDFWNGVAVLLESQFQEYMYIFPEYMFNIIYI